MDEDRQETDSTGEPEDEAPAAVNEVRLRGRLAVAPEERELPSGDVLCTWRLVVDRPPQPPRAGPAGGVRVVTVDALDCTAWSPTLRRRARDLAVGDVVEVEGALRRRFWRAGAGAASRTEVEVSDLRRVGRTLPRARRRTRLADPSTDPEPVVPSG